MFKILRNSKKRLREAQIRAAHDYSNYRHWPANVFREEVFKLARLDSSKIDFDESLYLAANDDVRRAVAAGDFFCGYLHFCLFGQSEPRIWGDNRLFRERGIHSHVGEGLFKPTHFRDLPSYGPDLSTLPLAAERTLLILTPHLKSELFFAGYSGFFEDLCGVTPLFSRVIVAVMSEGFEPELVRGLACQVDVIHYSELSTLKERPNVVVHFDAETFYVARDVFNMPDRTIYYCQDFEAGFFPLGSMYARAERAVVQARNIVVSTTLLFDFFSHRGLISDANFFVTCPSIRAIQVEKRKNKRLFFYFRPEAFNSRNMAEVVMSVVKEFCAKHSGYEVFLCGAVDTCYSFTFLGTPITVLSKLPKADYESLLASCDVVVALIYSAHPGVIAFQAAASGIPTITNTFEARTAVMLEAVSHNILAFDPLRDVLLDKIEVALGMPKGVPSFNADAYSKSPGVSLGEYVEDILSKS